jgi:chromosome segregation ATPase
MSDTPRTDSVTEHHYTAGGLRSASVVQAWFARELERELAALRVEVEQRTAELNAREVELTALKNAKSLAEMWRELDTINSVVSQRDEAIAERGEANAKLAELSTVCEAQQSLILTRNKTLDVIIKELETANTKIKTLESKVIEQEDEINDLYYQQAYREEMN